MEKALYFRTHLKRPPAPNIILKILSKLESPARLLIEVFIRKDFGIRYFRLFSALVVTLILGAWPFLLKSCHDLIARYSEIAIQSMNPMQSADVKPIATMATQDDSFFNQYILWYIYLAVFFALSVKHHIDQKRNPSMFDFKKFSLYSGDRFQFFYNIKIPGVVTDNRLVECILEPLLFFLAGYLISFTGQKLGGLLMLSSIIYAASYIIAYANGDEFVLNMIDQMIKNRNMEKAFMEDVDEKQTSYYRYMGSKPEDQDRRKRVYKTMRDEGAEDDFFDAN